MKRLLLVYLSLFILLLSSTGLAEPVRKRTPLNVAGQDTGSIVFATLLAKIAETGKIAGLEGQYIKIFNDALRQAGHNVPGGDTSIFKEEALPDTDYLLAGAILDLDCSREMQGTCALTVEWELLDRRNDEVVYSMTAKHEEMRLKKMGTDPGVRALLLGVLNNLMARQKFVDALKGAKLADSAPAAPAYEPRSIKRCTDPAPAMPKDSEKALAATVVVKVNDGVGSGVFISPDGFILTAAHVAVQDELDVRLRDGSTKKAKVVRLDEDKDIALLQLVDHSKPSPCLPLSTDTAKAGADIFVLGSPAGEELSFSISRGIVSGNREFEGTSYLQTDAAINPGNSGGPFVNAEGQVVAIASWKVASKEMEGLGFGVPSSAALNALAIRLGDETETIGGTIRRKKVSVNAVVDAPDPDWFYVGKDAPGRTPGWVRPVRNWGWLTALTGTTLVITSFALAEGNKDVNSFNGYRTMNTIGWVLAGVGTGMIVSSYVFKPKPKVPTDEHASGLGPLPRRFGSKPTVAAGIGLGSATLKVTF